ncbi:MAG: hypothetical protein ACI9OI_002496, partial [Chitinophagales bacterium]
MNNKTIILTLVSFGALLAGAGLFSLATSNPDIAIDEIQPTLEHKRAVISLESIPLTDLDGNQKVIGHWQQPVLI